MTLTKAGRLMATSLEIARACTGRQSQRSNYCISQSPGPPPITILGEEVTKTYNPINFEPSIRERWKSRDKNKTNKVLGVEMDNQIFRMILPPPNVTGKLHLGHALTVAIQDTILRLKFMTGSRVEWIPGFDHAGIATQSLVTRKLRRNSETKNPSSEKLEEELHKYAQFNKERISEQLVALGALLDWEKEYYTLDETHSSSVREAFIHLFDNGTIKRGDGIVNWSCPLQTTISDIEVEEVAFNGRTSFRVPGYDNPVDFGVLYFCQYQVSNSDENVVIATSRPETMFGDTGIAVHPEDPRYQHLIGRTAKSPLTGKDLQIVGDAKVRRDFGSGALKITPAHDKLDFAIGADHGLPSIKTFAPDGNLNDQCAEFKGLGRFTARSKIIELLKRKGALVDTKEYTGSIGLCSRTQDVIEPFLIPHWYFKTTHWTSRLLDSIWQGEFTVKPDYQLQNFIQLLKAQPDWCLSRQIQWGHRIPAYYHKDFPASWVAASNIQDARKFLEDKLKIKINGTFNICQDPDVLDTWFSSSLIPLSLSGWPDNEELHQLSLMETGYDILLFWVWRMTMMNLALTDELPFRNVILHGVVTDAYGRKMSKSKGNVIDPMDVVNGRSQEDLISDTKESLNDGDLDLNEHDLRLQTIKKDYQNGLPACGADALRFSLLSHDIFLQNINLNMTYVENCKHFCNKLWQAMRFYLLHADESTNHPVEIAKPSKVSIKSFGDQWILACLYQFAIDYEEYVKGCRFHLATESIRNFLYAQYCNVYLELVKNDLRVNLHTEYHILVMRYAFCTGLKFAHPFLPFVTEEIWNHMTEGKKGLILDTRLPSSAELEEFRNDKAINTMKKGILLSKEIRSLRTKYLPGSKEKREFFIELPEDETDVMAIASQIETLTKAKTKFCAYSSSTDPEMLGTSFLIEGLGPCRISILKSDITKMPRGVDELKLTKMQDKLSKLKKQFDSPSFQQFAPTEAKERLKKRLDTLQMRIDEANKSRSSEHEG